MSKASSVDPTKPRSGMLFKFGLIMNACLCYNVRYQNASVFEEFDDIRNKVADYSKKPTTNMLLRVEPVEAVEHRYYFEFLGEDGLIYVAFADFDDLASFGMAFL